MDACMFYSYNAMATVIVHVLHLMNVRRPTNHKPSQPTLAASLPADYCHSHTSLPFITSGQRNLISGHIAAAHGQFSRILQVAPMCNPIYRKPKMVAMATSLRTSKSAMSSSDSLTRKTYHQNQTACRYSLAIIQPKLQPIKRQSQLQQIAPQNWLPWQRPSAPMDPHPMHDSYGPSEPTTQTTSLSVQPSLHRRPQSVPILYNGTPILPQKFAPSHGSIWTPI